MTKKSLFLIASSLTLIIIILTTLSTANNSFPLRKRLPRPFVSAPHLRHDLHLQDSTTTNNPYLSEIKEWLSQQLPSTNNNNNKMGSKSSSHENPIISDVLPKNRLINVYASLTRQFDSVESRFNDPSSNVTVLAPRNSAIQNLPRKPWENPEDYERFGQAGAYEGDEGQDRATKNLERFVKAHVVVGSPWGEGDEGVTLAGEKVTWNKGEGGKIYIQPGNVEVDSVAEKVSNGELWILNGVVNYT
ncbi:FAS1 domain-containing protein AN1527 precursor [Aspergillus eucalypticola CBS 122712]|uniref:FAS1 domain-containing protein AN1527 n=1 Tax=Aspergillus eucalypticola (strain CBS 122712 / IBT 29274) TaxID=1448314 RepID=A0A317V9H2_ASPEC|nr:FAS1 domain-containing protein AN1527 precursor [Aspergillus eucalypticola CBS 122712]PWY69901.1 FAS1 domain-containing protein AN1527 precursor [Aspergillus eucalypticola CBS 122712]